VHSELRLRFLKYLINLPARLLDRLLKFPEATYPQTQMLLRVYSSLLKTYRVECLKGVFDVPDGNFERLLRVSAKVLTGISESDRYYRAMLGLVILLASEEYAALNLSAAEVKALMKKQWLEDVDCLPDRVIEKNLSDFKEMVMCWSLSNHTRK
jgi:hypothetical protein